MRVQKILAVTATVVLALSAGVQATPITVPNYSFEAPVIAVGGYLTFPSIAAQGGSGWTFDTAPRGDWGGGLLNIAPGDPYITPVATDGLQVAFSNGNPIYQSLDYTVVNAGDVFTLTVDVGRGNTIAGNQTYVVGLFMDAPAVANIVAQDSQSTGTITQGTWNEITVNYTATADDVGKNVGIWLSCTFDQALFDNVQLDVTPVPEPATMALLSFGGIGLLLRRKR